KEGFVKSAVSTFILYDSAAIEKVMSRTEKLHRTVLLSTISILGFVTTGQAADFNCAGRDVACLIAAINAANANGQANTINLAAGVYTLVSVNNVSDGANGLPVITGALSIKGAGPRRTIIERSENAPHFRIM